MDKFLELPDEVWVRPLRSGSRKQLSAVRPESPLIEQNSNNERMCYTKFVRADLMAWQDIGTAPKDRIPILIHTSYGRSAVAYGTPETKKDYGWVDYMRPQHGYGSVTHWQPLPLPPKV